MLSQKGRYALKALLNLARHAPESRPAASIAEEEHIPRRFLEVILADLRDKGLVQSTRGRAGGFRLSRPADEISFADIMRVTDGPLALLPCASHNFYERCADCEESVCILRKVFSRLRIEVSELLGLTTLAAALEEGGQNEHLFAAIGVHRSSGSGPR